MAEYYENGDSIESQKTLIITRKLVRESFIKLKPNSKGIKYKCSRNSSAEITQELVNKVQENLHGNNPHTQLGDKLKCENLYFINESLKPVKGTLIMGSGQHEATQCNLKDRTYAEIERPFKHVQDAINKKMLESKEQLE